MKLLDDLLGSDRGFKDRWYVTNGEEAVGPVNLELLARGIESGKVPLDSFVRNEAWTVWRPLSDIAMVTVPRPGAPQSDDSGTPSDERSTPRLPGVSAHVMAAPASSSSDDDDTDVDSGPPTLTDDVGWVGVPGTFEN